MWNSLSLALKKVSLCPQHPYERLTNILTLCLTLVLIIKKSVLPFSVFTQYLVMRVGLATQLHEKFLQQKLQAMSQEINCSMMHWFWMIRPHPLWINWLPNPWNGIQSLVQNQLLGLEHGMYIHYTIMANYNNYYENSTVMILTS